VHHSGFRLLSRPVIFLIALASATTAVAAELEAPPVKVASPPAPQAWSWTGVYLGGQLGGAASTAHFSDPFGPSIYGDTVTAPGFLAGGKLGFNWQVPNLPWVFGIEADLNWLNASGTNTCLAISGFFVSANCQTQPNMMSDLTARAGMAYGPGGHSLLYVKGGTALVHEQVGMTTNATADFIGLAPQMTNSSYNVLGWTVGGGIEHAITPAWSLVFEYDYASLGPKTVATPEGILQVAPPAPIYFLTLGDVSHINQSFQEAKLGLNYRFGIDPMTPWDSAATVAFPVKAPAAVSWFSGWEIETGARYFGSNATFQKDLGDTTSPALSTMLTSRLAYQATANSGEGFARVEAPQNFFLKGNLGAGGISAGQLNDEDWVVFGGAAAYSNTISSPVGGSINYATADLGYDFLRDDSRYRLGAFAGYNYYRQNESAYGCSQIGSVFSDCVPSISSSVLVITEDDLWQSLRIGLNGELMMADRLKLEADIAFLPYVRFSGTDNHVLEALTIQESGVGTGVQLEGALSYMITDQLSLGLGGRYWSMWTNSAAIADFAGAACPCQTQPAKATLYGVFVQASYQFRDVLSRQ
jgi:opacity protein-like surface antigen